MHRKTTESASPSGPRILTAHQPVYLPWLGLFHKIALADHFVSFDQVQYLPRDWNNRNKIKTAQGPIWLTVPVHTKGHREKALADMEINNSLPWARKHWKSISLAYRKAPHFDRYAPRLEEFYGGRWDTLESLNTAMLRWFLDVLGIGATVSSAGEYDFQGQKSALVQDMCTTLGADVYIFGAQGRDYADVDAFRRAGVMPWFQEYAHPVYGQLHGGFEPYMSVLDLLFNHGDESLGILLSGNASREDVIAQWRGAEDRARAGASQP